MAQLERLGTFVEEITDTTFDEQNDVDNYRICLSVHERIA